MMAIGTIISRFGNALASAAFAGLTCFGTAAMAQTPVTTAPADVMLNQVRADLNRILTVTDLGVMSFGDVHIEPIDIHWGRIVDGAPLVHFGEIPDNVGAPSGSSVVVDILNKKGEPVEQVWVGFFVDAELQWGCDEFFCPAVPPEGSMARANATAGAITGDLFSPEFPVYVMLGVIDPESQAKWVFLGANPECPLSEADVFGDTIFGSGCDALSPDGDPVLISIFAPAMSGLSEVAGLIHKVRLDAAFIVWELIIDDILLLVSEVNLTLSAVGPEGIVEDLLFLSCPAGRRLDTEFHRANWPQCFR